MRPASLLSLLGFFLLIIATFCPMLRPFHLFNMNVYKLNQPYGIVLLLAGVIGLLCTVLNQQKVVRLTAWASMVLVVLLYVAAYLKVNASFSFIPFKGIEGFLKRQIAFKWGWYILFAGPVLAVLGAVASKQRLYTEGE